MNKHWIRLLAIFLAVGVIAAACGSDDNQSSSTASDTSGDTSSSSEAPDTTDTGGGTAQTGGDCDATVPGSQINYGVFAPASAIDPTRQSGALVGGTELAAFYDVLMTYDIESGEYSPHLAESLESNDDFTEWTLTLREGITYSDGTPLTAQLVLDSIDRFFGEDLVTNTSAGFLSVIESSEAVDDLTATFSLSSPFAGFPFILADEPGMIVNVNAIGDDVEAFGQAPPAEAGLGPFTVERLAPGEELVMKAREDYWAGPVCLETLRFVWVPGSQPTYDAFKAEDLNVGFLRDPVVIDTARTDGVQSSFVNQDAGAGIIVNHREGRPGSDPRIREAIALAIDETQINDSAYQGKLAVSKTLIGPDSRYFSDAIEAIPTDTERAAQLVEEAKADGFDGAIDVLCSTSPPAPDVGLTVQGQLNAVGFDATATTLGQTEQIGAVATGEYDSACWGFNAGPATIFTTFLRNLGGDSQVNRLGYASDAMDAALESVLAAGTLEEQQAALAEVNQVYNDDFVSVNYGSTEEGIVWADDVSGIITTSATIFLFHAASVG